MELKKGTIILFIVFVLLMLKYTFQDVVDFFKVFGGKIFPSNPGLGIFIILLTVIVVIYYKEINSFFNRIVRR